MTNRSGETTEWHKRWQGIVPVLCAIFLGGCLTTPPVEETWTKLEILEAAPGTDRPITSGAPVSVSMKGRITFREILTSSAVAEVRWSDTLESADFALDAVDPRLESVRQIDMILENSISIANETVLVTGFDYLIREVNFRFDATIPGPGTAFLLLYMAEDIEDIELESGADSTVINPFLSTEAKILAAGVTWTIE